MKKDDKKSKKNERRGLVNNTILRILNGRKSSYANKHLDRIKKTFQKVSVPINHAKPAGFFSATKPSVKKKNDLLNKTQKLSSTWFWKKNNAKNEHRDPWAKVRGINRDIDSKIQTLRAKKIARMTWKKRLQHGLKSFQFKLFLIFLISLLGVQYTKNFFETQKFETPVVVKASESNFDWIKWPSWIKKKEDSSSVRESRQETNKNKAGKKKQAK